MSTPQRNDDACILTVSPETADVVRLQSLIVLEINHDYFEYLLDFTPAGQQALAHIYRDAINVIEALGWDPETVTDVTSFQVPLTAGHVDQLRRRRLDLGLANLNRLQGMGADIGDPAQALKADHDAAHTLDDLIATYEQTTRN